MDISKYDPNFRPAVIEGREILYRDIMLEPFVFEGLAWDKKRFFRLPPDMTSAEVNEGALEHARHTAGCAVRFKSDSGFVALRAKLSDFCDMNHMPRCGSAGFDLYGRNEAGEMIFLNAFQPNPREADFERIVFPRIAGKMTEYLLNFPLYGSVGQVEIGLEPGSLVEAPVPHKIGKPILFYGSSITQGGCASRPGNAYTNVLCRKLDAEGINLGFSGCGKGEIAVANAIAELDLSCFVLDYDHDAPDPEHLERTHEPFFKAIRARRPDLPVLMMSRCDFYDNDDCRIRRDIVRRTYENALAAGDRHVAYIDGELLWGKEDRDACSVDGCHPNDFGFYRMVQVIYPVLKKLLQGE